MEIERKFLFDEIPDFLEKENNCILRTNIKQTYLSLDPEIRIRRVFTIFADYTSNNKYYFTKKGAGNLSRDEDEYEISKCKYIKLKTFAIDTDSCEIEKDYYRFKLDNGLILECSLVDKDLDSSFIYGEIEFESEEQANNFIPPEFFGKEVTYDEEYKMKNYFKRTRKK